MRRLMILLAALLATLVVVPLAPQAASAAAPYCGITWGSVTKNHNPTGASPLVNVRAGRHACFDRLVLDFRGKTDGYRVEYVSDVFEDGSGRLVPLRGGAKLQIVAYGPAYDDQYGSTYTPANRRELVKVTGWQTFRQVAWAGSFEGQSNIGLGVRARLPFQVFVLDGPGGGSRIVIDVAHYW